MQFDDDDDNGGSLEYGPVKMSNKIFYFADKFYSSSFYNWKLCFNNYKWESIYALFWILYCQKSNFAWALILFYNKMEYSNEIFKSIGYKVFFGLHIS